MAKKVVATLQKAGSKTLAKVIRSVRSAKTGAYTFKEEMVPTEAVQAVLARDTQH
jgi:Domain of unknown function (DUF4295)